MPNFNPSVTILYDTAHPLIEEISNFLSQQNTECRWVHWRDLSLSTSEFHTPNFQVYYLDRLGELSRTYSTQLDLLSTLEKRGATIINSPRSYWIARNKALSAMRFQELSIPTPETLIAYSLEQIKAYVLSRPGSYLCKPILGCCGENIIAFESESIPEHEILSLLRQDSMILIQPFIWNSKRFIWRIDIVGQNIIVANKRYANDSSFHPICNGTLGGKVEFYKPQEVLKEVSELALKSISALGLKIAGIDILPTDAGELFLLEVNPEPDITQDCMEFPLAIANQLSWAATQSIQKSQSSNIKPTIANL